MITKNYINQCEQAEVIQKAWKPKLGDICLNRFDGKKVIIIEKGVGVKEYKVLFVDVGLKMQRNYWYSKVNLKWLPTQEQLQEIIKHNCYENNNFKSFISDFYYYLLDEYENIDKCESLNEAWISFYMHEKYHKIWTGEKWVKAE